jgi:hypothetical protein
MRFGLAQRAAAAGQACEVADVSGVGLALRLVNHHPAL